MKKVKQLKKIVTTKKWRDYLVRYGICSQESQRVISQHKDVLTTLPILQR